MSEANSIYIHSIFLVHFNIILPSLSRCTNWSLHYFIVAKGIKTYFRVSIVGAVYNNNSYNNSLYLCPRKLIRCERSSIEASHPFAVDARGWLVA
jgi:hypothetical protein